MKIRAILENISPQQRGVGQLPADFDPPNTSPQLSGPYPGRNATRGYLVGESSDMSREELEQEIERLRQRIREVGEQIAPGNHPQAIDARRRAVKPIVRKKRELEARLAALSEDVQALDEQRAAQNNLKEFQDDDDSGGGDDKGFPGRGSWKLNTGHYDTALDFFSLFGPDEYQDRWIKDPKTGAVAWEGWRRDQGDTDALGRSIPGELRKMAGFRWDNADESPEDDAPGTGWYYSWSPDWKDIYRQGRDPKGGVQEGHADQQRKIFRRNGQPVGEVGIDRESSPGVGQYYMKHYASGTDNSGYDSYEDALDELRHVMKQSIYGELREHDGRDDEPEEIDDDGRTMADRARRDGRGSDDEPETAAQQRKRSLQATRDFNRGRRADSMREGVRGGKDISDMEMHKLNVKRFRKDLGLPDRDQPKRDRETDMDIHRYNAERFRRDLGLDEKPGVSEGGPFSYGAKKPRKGSVADSAAKKRREQERNKQPIEPRDQQVGTAKVTKGVAEGTDFFDRFGLPIMPDDDGKFQDMMRGIKQGTKKQARVDRRERDAASRERAQAAFGPSPADKLSIRPDQGVAESGYNPLDDERREQSRIDAERAQFRRDELAAELGGEEQRAQQIMQGTWYIVIDGQVWRRQGEPVTFSGREAARRAGQTIKNRSPGKTVTITTKLPTAEQTDPRQRLAQMRAQTQSSLQAMRANTQATRDRLRGGAPAPAVSAAPAAPSAASPTRPRKTNAAGVTQHDWMAQAQKQGARLIQAKMVDGPVIAIYPDGRRDVWQPVGDAVSESVKQHHFIYETHERMFEEYNREKEREEWAARKAYFVQQAMDRDEKRREYERQKKEKEAEREAGRTHAGPQGQHEYIAPHGDARNEVAMFQAGTKPAALINPPDVGIWSDLINSGRYVLQRLKLSGQPDGYVIGQPGEEERVEKIHALVQNANDRAQQGDFSPFQNSNYHRWLGRLLGYPASKIEQFISNYFRDTPDRAQARYDEDADFHRGRQPGVRYAIRDAQGRVLSTHDDIDSARDELQGIQDREGYRIVQTRQPARSWNITEEPLDMDLIKRAQGGMAGTNQDPDSERFRDQPYGYRDRAQNKFDPMAKLDKGSVNSIERALGIKWPKHRAWQGTVRVDESREQRYARVFREAVASGMALEDVVDQVRGELGDYLQIVARAMKKRPEAMKPRQRPEDRLGPPLRTIHTDDGREIHIHGNEDDGFRISIGGRTMRESFSQLSEAEIATEIYCARRRQRDYQQER